MGRKASNILIAVSVVTFILSIGCKGRSRGNIPQTAPVSGIVTLDGKPVDDANVIFVPTGTPAYGAYAMTDSAGRFTLKTSETVTGAVPGTYLVKVTKVVPDPGGKRFILQEEAEHEALASGGSSTGGEGVAMKNVLPEKYANPKTSGIEITVPSQGIQDLEIKLTSQ